jgi:hypothetical protein
MFLPEIIHLPAIILLVLVVVSGIALPTAVPFAVTHSSPGQWGLAFGAVLGAVGTNLGAWFGYRAARRALRNTCFLGFTSRLWSVGIPLAYIAGLGFGIYLCFLFYV